ncbi:hypothetical protein, partial [Corynebacterium diphtheriae]|uniref:hypothetical protein n=1 Tax=Corynebacterium diphtheriae TaxID=1717 RepID=UPI0019D3E6D8
RDWAVGCDLWSAINSAYVDINSDLSSSVTFHATNGATLGRGGAIVRGIGLCLLAYLAHGR